MEWYIDKWFWIENNYSKTAMLLMVPFILILPLVKILDLVYGCVKREMKK